MSQEKVYRGTVRFYNQKKGYGFIDREDNKGDIFFHHTGLVDKDTYPQQNDQVEFEVEQGRKGKDQAIKVRRVK
ncbi:unnamed protein product [marine sediment metagenome]|uniref:CSD domain-containing protein n=1 Tax=marine sediment metagenome TaxID=412755 RepID=X1G669_9ZZZZ